MVLLEASAAESDFEFITNKRQSIRRSYHSSSRIYAEDFL